MSSNCPPQLHLSIPPSSTSFKRSFEQFGFDLDSPVVGAASNAVDSNSSSSSSSNGHDRTKRARSASSFSDGSDSLQSSQSSSSASASGSSTTSVSTNLEVHSNQQPSISGLSRPSLTLGASLAPRPSPSSPPRLPTPDIDVEMPDVNLPTAATAQLSDTYRLTLQRFNAFESEIAALRRSPMHVPTPPPTLPPLQLSGEQEQLSTTFLQHQSSSNNGSSDDELLSSGRNNATMDPPRIHIDLPRSSFTMPSHAPLLGGGSSRIANDGFSELYSASANPPTLPPIPTNIWEDEDVAASFHHVPPPLAAPSGSTIDETQYSSDDQESALTLSVNRAPQHLRDHVPPSPSLHELRQWIDTADRPTSSGGASSTMADAGSSQVETASSTSGDNEWPSAWRALSPPARDLHDLITSGGGTGRRSPASRAALRRLDQGLFTNHTLFSDSSSSSPSPPRSAPYDPVTRPSDRTSETVQQPASPSSAASPSNAPLSRRDRSYRDNNFRPIGLNLERQFSAIWDSTGFPDTGRESSAEQPDSRRSSIFGETSDAAGPDSNHVFGGVSLRPLRAPLLRSSSSLVSENASEARRRNDEASVLQRGFARYIPYSEASSSEDSLDSTLDWTTTRQQPAQSFASSSSSTSAPTPSAGASSAQHLYSSSYGSTSSSQSQQNSSDTATAEQRPNPYQPLARGPTLSVFSFDRLLQARRSLDNSLGRWGIDPFDESLPRQRSSVSSVSSQEDASSSAMQIDLNLPSQQQNHAGPTVSSSGSASSGWPAPNRRTTSAAMTMNRSNAPLPPLPMNVQATSGPNQARGDEHTLSDFQLLRRYIHNQVEDQNPDLLSSFVHDHSTTTTNTNTNPSSQEPPATIGQSFLPVPALPSPNLDFSFMHQDRPENSNAGYVDVTTNTNANANMTAARNVDVPPSAPRPRPGRLRPLSPGTTPLPRLLGLSVLDVDLAVEDRGNPDSYGTRASAGLGPQPPARYFPPQRPHLVRDMYPHAHERRAPYSAAETTTTSPLSATAAQSSSAGSTTQPHRMGIHSSASQVHHHQRHHQQFHASHTVHPAPAPPRVQQLHIPQSTQPSAAPSAAPRVSDLFSRGPFQNTFRTSERQHARTAARASPPPAPTLRVQARSPSPPGHRGSLRTAPFPPNSGTSYIQWQHLGLVPPPSYFEPSARVRDPTADAQANERAAARNTTLLDYHARIIALGNEQDVRDAASETYRGRVYGAAPSARGPAQGPAAASRPFSTTLNEDDDSFFFPVRAFGSSAGVRSAAASASTAPPPSSRSERPPTHAGFAEFERWLYDERSADSFTTSPTPASFTRFGARMRGDRMDGRRSDEGVDSTAPLSSSPTATANANPETRPFVQAIESLREGRAPVVPGLTLSLQAQEQMRRRRSAAESFVSARRDHGSDHEVTEQTFRLRGSRIRPRIPPDFSRRRLNGFNLGDFMRDEDFDDSYEHLLSLNEAMGEVKPRCTPAHVIASLETGEYKDWANPDSDKRCPICLDDYVLADPVLKLNNCSHWMHKGCLQQWLQGATTCPVCRMVVHGSSPSQRLRFSTLHRRAPRRQDPSASSGPAGPSGSNGPRPPPAPPSGGSNTFSNLESMYRRL